RLRVLPAAISGQGPAVHGLHRLAAHSVDADPDSLVPHYSEAAPVQHLVGPGLAVRRYRPAPPGADIPRLLRSDSARATGKRPYRRLHRGSGAAADRRPVDQTGAADWRDPGHDQRLGRLPVADDRHPGPAQDHDLGRSPAVHRQFRPQPDRRRCRLRRVRAGDRAGVPPRRLHHAVLRLRPHPRSHQAMTLHPPPSLVPARLRCAHLVNPLGVAPGQVRFSWLLEGAGSNRSQRGYQMLVTAAGPDHSHQGVVWDSGRVERPVSTDIEYEGQPLHRGCRYAWRVRVWDENDSVSEWSEPGFFEVELDSGNGWRASWIGPRPQTARPPAGPGPVDPIAKMLTPAPYLRRVFTAPAHVVSARLYVTALGLYEARLNGRRVGDAALTPGWTDYNKRVLYQTYDV